MHTSKNRHGAALLMLIKIIARPLLIVLDTSQCLIFLLESDGKLRSCPES